MNTRRFGQWAVLIGILSGTCTLLAVDPEPKVSPAEAELRQAGQAYAAALEKGDYSAAAEFWTKEGTYVDAAGQSFVARERLVKAAGNKQPPRLVQVGAIKVRFLTPDVAIEEGTCDFRDTTRNAVVNGKFSALWIKQDKFWRLENLRESVAEPVVDAEPLAGLEIFVGQWTGQQDKLNVVLTVSWNSTKKYLVCEYTLSSDNKTVFHGSQRIVWDPLAKQIRGFAVGDDGSFGSGVWSREGTIWMMTSNRVLPDGKHAQSTQTFKFRDRDTLDWSVIRNTIEGQPLPEMKFTLQRAKSK